MLFIGDGEMYVTVGSDQTDRDLETQSIEMVQAGYPDIFAPEVWRYSEVQDHWDQLVLRCWVTKDGERRLYQEATLAEHCRRAPGRRCCRGSSARCRRTPW